MSKYCECRRRIKLRRRGKWITPQCDHTQCRQCRRSYRDSLLVSPPPREAPTSRGFFCLDDIIMPMQLTSSAFNHNMSIPSKYTCDGDRTKNPPFSISDVPEEMKSLALIMNDPDVPKQIRTDGVFDHWILFNIPAETTEILEGVSVGTPGVNSSGKNLYTGPCPPPQYEPSEHRYIFKLYALDTMLNLQAGTTKKEVLDSMKGHVLAETELIGRYKRR